MCCVWVFFIPRTCCSSCMMTSTAMLRMPSLVCGLSDFKCVMHMRPNSLSASLISRIRILFVFFIVVLCRGDAMMLTMMMMLGALGRGGRNRRKMEIRIGIGIELCFDCRVIEKHVDRWRKKKEKERQKKKRDGLLQCVRDSLPLTRCSSCVMTSTAWWSTVNLGCALSLLRWSWHMRPSSLNASFMSLTRTLHVTCCVTIPEMLLHHLVNPYINHYSRYILLAPFEMIGFTSKRVK